MKSFFKTCGLALLVCAIPCWVAAQTSKFFYGDNDFQSANCFLMLPNGDMQFGGRTNPTGVPTQRIGYLFGVDAASQTTFDYSRTYSQGNGQFEILSMDVTSVGNNIVSAGYTIPANQGHRDAFYMITTPAGGNFIHARFWNGPGNETARKIKALPDQSVVVVGKVVTNTVSGGVAQAFVTRIASGPTNNVIFHRLLGASDRPSAKDEAVAVEQLPDGRLLVLGTTQQFARTSQGAIFLAVLALDGTVEAYHTYHFDASVFGPVAYDMTLFPDGTVVVVGNTENAQGSGTPNGFVMKVAPNLLTATFEEANQPGLTHLGEEFRAVTRTANANNYFIVGGAERTVSGVTGYEALAMRFDIASGVQATKTTGFPGEDDEFFNDVIERTPGLLEAVGSSEKSFRPITNLTNENVFDVRFSGFMTECDWDAVVLEFTPKGVTHLEPNVQSATTMATSVGTLAILNRGTFHRTLCSLNKMGEDIADPADPTVAELPAIYPNPASGSATLRIPDLDGGAAVSIADMRGRVVQQITTAQPETALDLSALAPGLYLARIDTRTHQVMQRLIVQ